MMEEKVGRSEREWVLGWAIVIVVLASLPYLWGWWQTPPGARFMGLTHNIDDGAVYLSWMRQAADGHFFIRDLFTSEPQPARAFNVLFLLMGGFAGLTHLPLIWVFHLFRVGLGIGLIFAVWKFSQLFLDKAEQRRILIPLIGLSAGVGWLIPGARMPSGPVDTWQPEAITFLSIYLNPLFLAGLILMLGSFYYLILAQRTGKMWHAIYAGLCLLVLGNVHTYDVLTVACVWTAYLIVLAVARRAVPWGTVGLSSTAALIASPSVAYQFYVYAADPVYRARANTPAPSPEIWSFLAGYGLILLGAIAGSALYVRAARRGPFPQPSTLNSQLPIVWSIAGFALPYIPIAQQRKLIMGLHIPLAILCAYALSWLLVRLPRRAALAAVAGFVLLSAGSNIRFLAQDSALLADNRTVTHHRPYLFSQELAAMKYLRDHAASKDVIFAPPDIALFTPAVVGVRVYYGHWSETPDYADKIRQWQRFAGACAEGVPLPGILIDSRASYLVHYVAADDCLGGSEFARRFLSRGFADDGVVVYRIDREKLGAAGPHALR